MKNRVRFSRRFAVITLLAVSVGAIFAQLSIMMTSFLSAPKKKNDLRQFVPLGTIGDVLNKQRPPELNAIGRFWLVHEKDGLVAFHSSCTHLECLFSWDQSRERFICPCHGSEYSRDGVALTGPATRNLDRLPIQIISTDNGEVVAEPATSSTQYLQLHDSKTEEPLFSASDSIQVDTGRKIKGKDRIVSQL